PNGYELRSATTPPAKVRLRGPASHVDKVSRVQTEKISLNNLNANTNIAQASVTINDDKVTISDPVVSVYLEISEQRIEKTFAGVPVRESSGATPRPQTATVTLYGERSLLEKLRAEEMQIVLDASEDGSINSRLVLPPGVEGRVELRNTKPTGFTIIK
ncbi:MAG: YbbR-like domain-containing protein, partial [Acidobacteria bacterium]|nr:YbbR-like domain-containing protein [Acidobacteriota bacterium]